MMISNLYGRIGQDPQARQTKAGKPMATTSIAVDVSGQQGEPETLWVSILAFGTQADTLLRAEKGQMLAAIGKMTRGEYTTKAGEVREQWTLLAESIVTAKSARPGGRRPQGTGQPSCERYQADRDFNDPIGF